jgi:NCS1 family nucleobase:cation symporter-1
MSQLVENHTIGPIPDDERSGKARDLFFVWFGANMFLITVVTGGLATTVFGLPLVPAIAAIALGLLVGGVFMALHAAQGPHLGVPQMIQSRGQFGAYGSLSIVVVVIVMYMGWFASNLVVSGQALHAVLPGLPVSVAIVLMTITNVLVAIIGYRMVHLVMKVGTVVLGTSFALAVLLIIGGGDLSGDALSKGAFSWTGFMAVLSISALWSVAYAPYVSDYSRYLPKATGARPAFWMTYGGITAGSFVPMLLGALVGTSVADGDVVGGLVDMVGPLGTFILWSAAIFAGFSNAMNLYGASLCTITVAQTFKSRFVPRAPGRAAFAGGLSLVALIIALAGADNFLEVLVNLIALMFFVITPWTAVNLADYYLVRRGQYDVAAFFRPDGGRYGLWNHAAMTCYGVGLLVQVPFLSTTLFTGPIAKAMDGVDISWIVGLAVTVPLYLVMSSRQSERQTTDPVLVG